MARAPKVPREFYETPPGFTRILLNALLTRYPEGMRPTAQSLIVEPTVGDGAIVRVLNEFGMDALTNDSDPARDAHMHYDATTPEFWALVNPCNLVVMNPPFSLALPILEHALRAAFMVAMHVRISWEEPTKDRIEHGQLVRGREDFLLANHWHGRIVLPRYQFDPTAKGTDSATTMWLIYQSQELREDQMSYPRWSIVAPRRVKDETFRIAA